MKKLKIISKELKDQLSPLEARTLEILLPDHHMRVREIYNKLDPKPSAQTSVAVILDRLYKKGLVDRTIESCRGGFRYTYYPITDLETYQKKTIASAVDKLIQRYGTVAMTYFNERFKTKKK